MLFVLHLAAFSTAFCTILPRILHHFTLHLAPKRTAFSTKIHRVLHQNALHFAGNGPLTGANDGFIK